MPSITVPYRWGQAENEQAWYEYVLENRSNSEAEEGFLDMTVNGVSTYNSADPAGCRATTSSCQWWCRRCSSCRASSRSSCWWRSRCSS